MVRHLRPGQTAVMPPCLARPKRNARQESIAPDASLRRECRYGAATLRDDEQTPMHRTALLLILALALPGCQTGLPDSPAQSGDLQAELVAKTTNTPPSEGKGICWADDVTPAIIETVTEQVLVQPEQRGPDGTLISAAVFQSETAQRIVQDRRDVWFRTPCPEMLTLDFVATLQRALKARGYFSGDLTGQLDAETRIAIRQYQEPLGLDSERLSLAATRRLGIVAVELKR